MNLRHVIQNAQIHVGKALDPQQAALAKALKKLPEAKADARFQQFLGELSANSGMPGGVNRAY